MGSGLSNGPPDTLLAEALVMAIFLPGDLLKGEGQRHCDLCVLWHKMS